MLKNYWETMFKSLSSVTFKNHSEEDELNPTSRLDNTCLTFFFQNLALTDSFQSETNHLKTATSMEIKKLFANRFGL